MLDVLVVVAVPLPLALGIAETELDTVDETVTLDDTDAVPD